VEEQKAMMDSEGAFRDADERLSAMSAYYGLCSWLDDNIGQILNTLDHTGQAETTTVIYSSDHGDNVGARGLWRKSNMYEESVAVPLMASGPDFAAGECPTTVSLIDVSETIAHHFGQSLNVGQQARPLQTIAQAQDDRDRVVFSEYHAAGAVSGAFMLRKGRWKLIHYIGFPDELFDLWDDPEETQNRATDRATQTVLDDMHAALCAICDVDAVDAQAFSDQAAMIARYGGRDAALQLGAPGATPPPLAKT